MQLSSPITALPGVGEAYATRLQRLGIATVGNLIDHFPVRYLDYSKTTPIARLRPLEDVCLKAQIISIKSSPTRRPRFSVQTAQIQDASGHLTLTWFNQPFLATSLQPNRWYFFTGKTNDQGQLVSPDTDPATTHSIHAGRLVPIYPQTYGVSSKWLRHKISLALKAVSISDPLAGQSPSLINQAQAYQQIHFPNNSKEQQLAEKRLAYNDLLAIHLKSALTKQLWTSQTATPVSIDTQLHQRFLASLPFTLTPDQQVCLRQIFADLKQPIPTNRLVQGDVGSGKTVVAAAAILQVIHQHRCAILMAPTQVLANQHHLTLSQFLNPFKINPSLVTSSSGKKIPDSPLLVGTHALLHRPQLMRPDLGLLIIDEQHRFGVLQRSHFLQNKSSTPHVLTLSATPIPRTIALSFYGHLDISNIKSLPKNRRPVKTWVVPETKRSSAYQWLQKEIASHHSQAFIVCPLIDDSESETLKHVRSATSEFTRLQKIFPQLKLALLHGRLKDAEKNQILADFKAKKYHILVSTPVIEVGLDVKNATVMLIEGADRFGLAQLHQLRGRVGRGAKQSYCLLFESSGEKSSARRLKLLERYHQGLTLARLDLKIRGSGEIFGTAQSGHIDTRFSPFWSRSLSAQARYTATTLVKKDPRKAQKLLATLNPQLANFAPAN